MTPWLSKLRSRRIWQRLLVERLSEPLHLNLLSLAVAGFGSIEAKIYFDLVIRQHQAFALLSAARKAKMLGSSRTTAVEFGVASGAGLMNMCEIASRLTPRLGVEFDVVGFDSGAGMPQPTDYRDHPEHYAPGDFPMQDSTALQERLPANARLVLGPLADTVPAFMAELTEASPLGFVSLDVDYFSSSVDALRIFDGAPEVYLPAIDLYVDDLMFETHNTWSGELGAIRDFNHNHAMRKIEPRRWLRESRVFKNASWLSHMYTVHVLDHAYRAPGHITLPRSRVLENPYLKAR
jgi:hypothetical protein